jgi:hypothetical protein
LLKIAYDYIRLNVENRLIKLFNLCILIVEHLSLSTHLNFEKGKREVRKIGLKFWNDWLKTAYDYIKHNVEKQSDETF